MKRVDRYQFLGSIYIAPRTSPFRVGVKEDAGSETQFFCASVFCHDGEYLPDIDVCEEITVSVYVHL